MGVIMPFLLSRQNKSGVDLQLTQCRMEGRAGHDHELKIRGYVLRIVSYPNEPPWPREGRRTWTFVSTPASFTHVAHAGIETTMRRI